MIERFRALKISDLNHSATGGGGGGGGGLGCINKILDFDKIHRTLMDPILSFVMLTTQIPF